jgi:tetratricopeptide (TPR) repeat protein
MAPNAKMSLRQVAFLPLQDLRRRIRQSGVRGRQGDSFGLVAPAAAPPRTWHPPVRNPAAWPEPAEALRLYDRAIATAAPTAAARTDTTAQLAGARAGRAEALVALNRPSEALDVLEGAVRVLEKNPIESPQRIGRLHILKDDILRRLARPEEADAAYRSAIAAVGDPARASEPLRRDLADARARLEK